MRGRTVTLWRKRILSTLLGNGASQAVRIADGQAHAARAASDLRIVEVRVGSPVGEDDAESFGFFWE